ncbi:MAG: aminotransferase class IV [Chloroflexota bacterium]
MWTYANINGRWVTREEAVVPIEDRGVVFGDGVYEVTQYYERQPIALERHMRRLQHGLQELRIELSIPIETLPELSLELLERNGFTNASVYWQISRGVAQRNHPFPAPGVPSSCFMMAYETGAPGVPDLPSTMRMITVPDDRWAHCDIKTIQLLPNVLARQAAIDAGCDDAIFIRDGFVMEASAKALAIIEAGALVFPPLDNRILPSITRELMIEAAQAEGIPVREAYFTKDELLAANEVLAMSTTAPISAVIEVDGQPINERQVGRIGKRLLDRFWANVAVGLHTPGS